MLLLKRMSVCVAELLKVPHKMAIENCQWSPQNGNRKLLSYKTLSLSKHLTILCFVIESWIGKELSLLKYCVWWGGGGGGRWWWWWYMVFGILLLILLHRCVGLLMITKTVLLNKEEKLSVPILRHRISITGAMLTNTPWIELVFAHLYKIRMMMLMLILRRWIKIKVQLQLHQESLVIIGANSILDTTNVATV